MRLNEGAKLYYIALTCHFCYLCPWCLLYPPLPMSTLLLLAHSKKNTDSKPSS